MDDLVDGHLRLPHALAIHAHSDGLLELGHSGHLIKLWLKKRQKLLIFVVVERAVVVKDSEQHLHQNFQMFAFKHE